MVAAALAVLGVAQGLPACEADTEPSTQPANQKLGVERPNKATPSDSPPKRGSDPSQRHLPAGLSVVLGVLPKEVLAGTDLEPLAEFMDAAPPPFTPGSYQIDNGGARCRAQLVFSAGGLTLVRTVIEPDEPTVSKTYRGLQFRDGKVWAQGDGIVVVSVNEGLLVLEQRSEVDWLSPDRWMFYLPSSTFEAM